MPTEADTCRTLITPKLQTAGWESDPHSIAEQRFFTDGRIVVHGNKAVRRKGKRADYILRYTRDFAIAVVEGWGSLGALLFIMHFRAGSPEQIRDLPLVLRPLPKAPYCSCCADIIDPGRLAELSETQAAPGSS